MNFAKRAEELSDQIIKDRRYLHQHPELSYKEKNTTAYLVASLKELGIPVQPSTTAWASTPTSSMRWRATAQA